MIGKITAEKVALLQSANQIFSVGVMGDVRTYGYMVAVGSSVDKTDFMTVNWSRLPFKLLEKVSSRIVSEVHGINRVTYDITSKPPGTIEWE